MVLIDYPITINSLCKNFYYNGSYVTFDNFARLMGGVVPGFISQAKPFIVKGKKDDIYPPASS